MIVHETAMARMVFNSCFLTTEMVGSFSLGDFIIKYYSKPLKV
jgi:hypothetical protein